MCAAPISAADGWSEADADWERLQVAAAAAHAAGDLAAATVQWAAALRAARASFDADDPRLATSLANHAVGLRLRGEAVPARMIEEALEIWDAAPAWLARQPLAPRARSSTFHLRLQARHPGAYDANLRRRTLALLAGARAATAALAAGAHAAAAGPGASQAVRAAPFDLGRKVLAAVRLLAASIPAAGAAAQDGS